jgi:hypothetical protein
MDLYLVNAYVGSGFHVSKVLSMNFMNRLMVLIDDYIY